MDRVLVCVLDAPSCGGVVFMATKNYYSIPREGALLISNIVRHQGPFVNHEEELLLEKLVLFRIALFGTFENWKPLLRWVQQLPSGFGDVDSEVLSN